MSFRRSARIIVWTLSVAKAIKMTIDVPQQQQKLSGQSMGFNLVSVAKVDLKDASEASLEYCNRFYQCFI